jgi:uncharacterized protein (TIGR00288 family)
MLSKEATMGQDRQPNLALLIDFDNVALGARDAGQRFDIKLLLQRILEKGKVLVKKAYADWHFYKEHMSPLHESAVELIEIPMPRISGKNSADIKLVVDAMDLCYSKDHIDTFVIVSGDSDFSPLVSKLRENNKIVIGVGVKNSSSKLLIGNCDEFIFYDDIFRSNARQASRAVKHVPQEKRELFDFLLKTTQSLLQESRGVLYSSLVKDTMTRKQPDFNERAYGYSNFGDLLEDARNLGLLIVERDAHAGGTWVVQGVPKGAVAEGSADTETLGGNTSPGSGAGSGASGGQGSSRSSRRRRRSSGRGRGPAGESAGAKGTATEGSASEAPKPAPDSAAPAKAAAPPSQVERPSVPEERAAKKTAKKPATKSAAKPTVKPVTKKASKTTTKKTTKTSPEKTTKKTSTVKKTAKKAPAKKTGTKKAPAKKAPAKKKVAKTTKKSSS